MNWDLIANVIIDSAKNVLNINNNNNTSKE